MAPNMHFKSAKFEQMKTESTDFDISYTPLKEEKKKKNHCTFQSEVDSTLLSQPLNLHKNS